MNPNVWAIIVRHNSNPPSRLESRAASPEGASSVDKSEVVCVEMDMFAPPWSGVRTLKGKVRRLSFNYPRRLELHDHDVLGNAGFMFFRYLRHLQQWTYLSNVKMESVISLTALPGAACRIPAQRQACLSTVRVSVCCAARAQ